MQKTSSQLQTKLMQLRKESLKRFSHACRDWIPDHCDNSAVVASLPPKKREEMTGNTSASRLLGYYSRPKRN